MWRIAGLSAALLLASIAFVPQPGKAQEVLGTDVLCLVVGANMMNSSDGTVKASGTAVVYYFLGRMDGAGARVDLATQMAAATEQLKGNNFSIQAKACGDILRARAEEFDGISAATTHKPPVRPF